MQARGTPPPTTGGSCPVATRPSKATFGDGGSREEKEAKSKLMSELLAIAMACDLTRVFSYEWSATQSGAVYWEVNSSTEHHQLNHNSGTGTDMKNVTKFIIIWSMVSWNVVTDASRNTTAEIAGSSFRCANSAGFSASSTNRFTYSSRGPSPSRPLKKVFTWWCAGAARSPRTPASPR